MTVPIRPTPTIPTTRLYAQYLAEQRAAGRAPKSQPNEDPLADYRPDWRQQQADSSAPNAASGGESLDAGDEDPLAGYHPTWRQSMPKASAAAGLLAAPLSVIPGATAATGVVQGLVDAGLNLVHGRPAALGESVRRGIDAQAADQAKAQEEAPFTTAGVRGAAMALTAAPSALLKLAKAPYALSDALMEAGQQAARAGASSGARQGIASRVAGSRVAQNAATGAAYSLAGRLGAATDESLGERLRAAPVDALAGAAAGAAIPAVTGAVAGRAARMLGLEPTPPPLSRGTRKMLTDVERSGKSLEQIESSYAPNMIVADAVGRPAQRRLDWSMSVPTEAEPPAAEFLYGRQGDRGTRLQRGVEDALGAERGNVVAQADALATTKRNRASVNYAAAEKAPPIDDLEVLAILAGSNKMQKLHGIASDMIQEETGRRPPPLVQMVTDEESGKRVPQLVPQSVAVFDMMKKAADDVIESGYLGTRKVGRNQARILRDKVRTALDLVDRARPEYAKARSEFATDAGNEQALQAGLTDALRVMPEDIARDLPDMPASAQQLYRQGAARNIWGHVTGKDAGSKSLGFFSQPIERQRVGALATDPDAAAAFQQLMGREKTMASTETGALRNSDTARRLQMNRDSEAGPPVDPEKMRAGLALLFGHPLRALSLGAQKLSDAYQMRMNGDMAKEITQTLTAGASGQDEFTNALQKLKLARAQRVPVTVLPNRIPDRELARAAGLLFGAP